MIAKPSRLKAYTLPELTNDTWAYIAGFFDGEASFCFNKAFGRKSNFRRITISMTHTHLPTLLWLQETLQIGSIYSRSSKLLGNHGKKEQYQFMVHNQLAVYRICEALQPFLREKQEQAISLMAYFEKKYGRVPLF